MDVQFLEEVRQAVGHYRRHPCLLRLHCGVQHYDWGGLHAIPELLGIENPDQRPHAELWIGAHPDLPAITSIGDTQIPLNILIEEAAEEILGQEVARRFNRELPFLLKVLSARKPLSIQAHPSKEQGREGFVRENRQGIKLTDEIRNYRDDHHKPELICALTDFYALRGFRPLREIESTLRSVPEFQVLARLFQPTQKSLVDLYAKVMRMDQREVNAILSPLIARLRSEHDRHKFGKDNIVYWVLKADQHFSTGGYKDRGIFSCYLLNLVHMVPGEAVHLPARELHAYLEGTGVEIMASSNNVLRGGFTLKHIDGEELLKILTFNCNCCQKPEILSPKHGATHGEWDIYETPAEEFVLSRLHLTEQGVYESETEHSMQLGIVIEGSVVFSPSEGTELHLSKGDSFLVPHGVVYGVSTDSEALIFQASVPSL